jgi:DNA repair exonuclease SbcCD ATPase subunit
LSQRSHYSKQFTAERWALKRLSVTTKRTREAQTILQEIGQAVQQQVHQQISSLVTFCLRAVFRDTYSFRIDFERKRGKTEARMRIVRFDGIEFDPMNEASGGVNDVTAFALRLASVVLTKSRPFLALDEPFKNVRGRVYQRRVKEMLEEVSAETGVQILMNTDMEELQTGKITDLSSVTDYS